MKKVLSIQSFVVHGHVGNSAAAFPLMLLGNLVDPLNTVHFCNHSGYDHFTGEITSPETLTKILKGLERNGFMKAYEYILLGMSYLLIIGYMGSTKNLDCIGEFLYDLKKSRPEVFILLDPVMGDHGKLYLPSENINIYKRLLSIASLITPNGFEASLLSGIGITDLNSIMKIFDILHSMGPKRIVITSTELCDQKPDHLYLLFSDSIYNKRFMIEFPKLKSKVSGTGDLFNSLLLGYLPTEISCENFAGSVEKACNAIQNILQNTKDQQELAIVESRDCILNPVEMFRIKNITV
jgi:pyridoxine kinase